MNLIHKDLGSYASIDGKLENGKLSFAIESPLIELLEPAKEKAKALIPGTFDDALIEMFWGYLKAELSK